MTTEQNTGQTEFVGHDAAGNEIRVGDRVRVLRDPRINEAAYGKVRLVRGAHPLFPIPGWLAVGFGGAKGFFDAVDEETGAEGGLHLAVVEKIQEDGE